ncbi:hypothetical protein AB3N59_05335 [Leptospira sp. WS92.C1]
MFIILGGIGLAACDQIHVQFEVLKYFHPGLFGQAWWISPQFMIATFFMYLGAFVLKKERSDFDSKEFKFAILWFVSAYFASGIFADHPHLLAVIYLLTWFFRMVRSREGNSLIGFSVILALAGTGAEGLISNAGFFVYTKPDFLLVPIWLPGLYLHGAPLIWSLVFNSKH